MEKEKEVIDLLEEILTAEQITLLRDMGYFEVPASTKRHLSVQGGLAQHSLNVTRKMLKLDEAMNYGVQRSWILMMGLLHDIVKLSYGYEANMLKNGTQSESIPYKANVKFDMGHGAGSTYLIINDIGLTLPVQVASAINLHMGFEFPKDNYTIETLKQNPMDMICVLLLQHADQIATWIDEVEFK